MCLLVGLSFFFFFLCCGFTWTGTDLISGVVNTCGSLFMRQYVGFPDVFMTVVIKSMNPDLENVCRRLLCAKSRITLLLQIISVQLSDLYWV